MSFPVVIIVGRPNVGKSALFNCLAKRKISIVDPTYGVTRDRVSIQIEHKNRYFELFDTGGIGINDVDNLAREISEQIEIAINEADLLLFVVDVRDGITPMDILIAEKFRKINKPTILVVNKVDSQKQEPYVDEFIKLGFGPPFPISAIEGYARMDLLDKIIGLLPARVINGNDKEPCMKLAVVGKRNVGKSTLVNTLSNQKRVIVSEVPGTTRDSIDVRFNISKEAFIIIDTAGLSKKGMMEDSIEFYSRTRTERSIRRADVVLFLLDVTSKISQVDKKIGDYIRSQTKPCIIVGNKWDLVKNVKTEEYARYIGSMLRGLSYAPISFISAINRENVIKTIRLAQELFRQAKTRISTAELNKFLEKAISLRRPSRSKSKIAKIFYGTQVSVNPPTFALFVNDKSLFDSDYERFLANQLRNNFPFSEIPLKLYFRPKN